MGRAEDLFERIEREGQSAISGFVVDRKTEELFLDFKNAATKGDKLEKSDRENYARALSGFANSEGGVIVWGVDARKQGDRGDVAQALAPIENVTRFVSLLEGETSGATDPAIPHVRTLPILVEGVDGYAITLVRQSPQAPHRSLRDDHYYLRSGSNFGRVPHRLLRGMFGHPEAPVLSHRFVVGTGIKRKPMDKAPTEITIFVFVDLTNEGPLPASDVYLTAILIGDLLGGSSVKFTPEQLDGWEMPLRNLGQAQVALGNGRRLPPLSPARVGALVFELKEPFENDIAVDLVYGHATSGPTQVRLRLDREKVANGFLALQGGVATEAQFFQTIRAMVTPDADEARC